MVIVWEDMHWADPSSLDYAALLIEQLPTAPLLLVLTARPHFSAPWTAKSHVTPITLNRLERPQIVALVKQLAKGKALPAEVLEHIVRKTDGVPLFVEELTRTILSSSVVRETETSYELTGPLSKLSIPTTLHESLMARLDRMPYIREVAQLGAVLGREFAYDVLHALKLVDDAVLDEGLSRLVADELLYQRGRIPRAKYIFKHALIQDAAYQSLLKRTRQHYHRQVALCIEQRSPEVAEQQPELLAYHYAGAAMAAQAVDCWLKAIKRAAGRAAYAEAFAQIDSGMELLDAEPDSRERTRMVAKLQLQRAFAFSATRGMGSAEAGKAFAEAQALCDRLGEATPESFYALYGACAFHVVRAEIEPALEVARESLRLAQIIGDPACITVAHRIVGSAYLWRGLPREAAHHFEEALRLYDALRDRESPLAAVADTKSIALSHLAMATALLGYPDKALALHDEALRHADRLGLPHNIGQALNLLGVTYMILRDDERGIECERRLMALSEKYGFPAWRAYRERPARPAPDRTRTNRRRHRAARSRSRREGNERHPAGLVRPRLDVGRRAGASRPLAGSRQPIRRRTCVDRSHWRRPFRAVGAPGLWRVPARARRCRRRYRGRGLLRQVTRSGARARRTLVGAARRGLARAAHAFARQDARGARTARAGLRLVHRRFRHA